MPHDWKLPRKLLRIRRPLKPLRTSHKQVLDNIERWVNSPGLRPPERAPAEGRTKSEAAPK